MSMPRLAAIGLACLLSGACTVVVQQPPNSEPEPEPNPRVSRPQPEPPPRTPPVRRNVPRLGIPPGQLPPAGACRVWIEGRPPGQQPRARACQGILETAPPGAWILYRPARYEEQIWVRHLDGSRRGVVVTVRVYHSQTGIYLRDLALSEDDDNMRPAPGIRRNTPVRRGADTTKTDRRTAGNQGNQNRGNAANAGNRGNVTVRADTARTNRGAAGNQGNQNRGNAANAGNRRNAGVQADTAKANRGNAGDQGNQNRGNAANAGNRGNVSIRADTAAANRGNAGKQGDQNRGNAVNAGNRGNAAGVQADTVRTNRGNAAGVDTTANTRSGRQGGVEVERRAGDEQRGQGGRTEPPPGRMPGDATPMAAGGNLPLNIEAGYFPRAGQCRVWLPSQPPGRQGRPASCNGIIRRAPAGAWILRRTRNEPNLLFVDYVDESRGGVISHTSVYDATTGAFIREEPKAGR